jgi:ribonucleotide reductase beta subunit family protein with ferritin-like domain
MQTKQTTTEDKEVRMLELLAFEFIEVVADAALSFIVASLIKKEKQSLKDHLKDSVISEAAEVILNVTVDIL